SWGKRAFSDDLPVSLHYLNMICNIIYNKEIPGLIKKLENIVIAVEPGIYKRDGLVFSSFLHLTGDFP
ncbi:MAG: hypothetical protein KAR13_22005, partial [Desulfobulbaceae bacterium]|nr:hypothetical protein [Desulfobulbaceae bacterium]